MSIESAKFIVQRGEDKLSCRGDELTNRLQPDDLLVVQHDLEDRASKFTWNGTPDAILDTDWLCCTDDDGVTYKVRGSKFKCLLGGNVLDYYFTQLTTDGATYLRPHIYEGKLLVTKENDPAIYEMNQAGTTTPFTDINFKPEWNVHFVLKAGSQTVVLFETPEYEDATVLNGTSDGGATWSYDQYTWSNYGIPDAMYTYGSKIVGVMPRNHQAIGTYLGSWTEKFAPMSWHKFDPTTGTLIGIDYVYGDGRNITLFPGLSTNYFSPNVSGGAVYAWAPINGQVVQVDTNSRITFPSNWSDKNQTGTVSSVGDFSFDQSPCSDWAPATGTRLAHVIDEYNIISSYEEGFREFTYSEYAPDGSLRLEGIDASQIGTVIEMFNIWGGTYAVTDTGLARLDKI